MWVYNNQIVEGLIKGFESFVYLIERTNIDEDNTSPRLYIGKKSFYSKRKSNGVRTLFESDWQDYYGSSDELKLDIERYGNKNFRREILHFCRTKGDSGYLEIKEQMNRDVLYTDENGYSIYYNKNINSRYHTHPDSFVLDNLSLYFQKNSYKEGNKSWVTNGKINKLIPNKKASSLVGNKSWVYGRTNPKKEKVITLCSNIIDNNDIKPKVSLFNNGDYQFIHPNDSYPNDWKLSKDYMGYKSYIATNGVSNKSFKSNESLIDFVIENEYWHNINEFSSNDKIPAINMVNDERVLVSTDEFSSDKMLIKLNTKKIKVKRKNRIIFQGYIELFILDNPNISKSLILKSLKNEGGFVKITGKNAYLTNERYSFKVI